MRASIAARQTGMITGHSYSIFQAAPECIGDTGIHQRGMFEYIQLRDIPARWPGQHVQHLLIGAQNTAFDVDDKDSEQGAITQKPILFFQGAQCIFSPPTSFFKFLDSERQFIAVVFGL